MCDQPFPQLICIIFFSSLRTMACNVCLVGFAEVAMVPCGHVCLCSLCRDALCKDLIVCPVCSEVVANTLKVYFPMATKVLPTPQKLLIVAVKEVQVAAKSSDAILALTDGKGVEEEKMEYVRVIEDWMDLYPDAQNMPEGEALQFMDRTVPPDVHAMLEVGNEKDYATFVISECARLWRSMAKRLHPDKSNGFWEEGDRLERLQQAFAYCNNVQEYVRKHFASHLLDCVGGVFMDYGLTDANALFLCIHLEPRPDVATVISFTTDNEIDMEIELQTGMDEISFNEEEYQYMFSSDFQGFLLAHKSVYGPHKGVESHAVPLIEPVPYALLESQQQIAMEMDEETRLAAFRRQLDEITDMSRKRKRAVDMRGGKEKTPQAAL